MPRLLRSALLMTAFALVSYASVLDFGDFAKGARAAEEYTVIPPKRMEEKSFECKQSGKVRHKIGMSSGGVKFISKNCVCADSVDGVKAKSNGSSDDGADWRPHNVLLRKRRATKGKILLLRYGTSSQDGGRLLAFEDGG